MDVDFYCYLTTPQTESLQGKQAFVFNLVCDYTFLDIIIIYSFSSSLISASFHFLIKLSSRRSS